MLVRVGIAPSIARRCAVQSVRSAGVNSLALIEKARAPKASSSCGAECGAVVQPSLLEPLWLADNMRIHIVCGFVYFVWQLVWQLWIVDDVCRVVHLRHGIVELLHVLQYVVDCFVGGKLAEVLQNECCHAPPIGFLRWVDATDRVEEVNDQLDFGSM